MCCFFCHFMYIIYNFQENNEAFRPRRLTRNSTRQGHGSQVAVEITANIPPTSFRNFKRASQLAASMDSTNSSRAKSRVTSPKKTL